MAAITSAVAHYRTPTDRQENSIADQRTEVEVYAAGNGRGVATTRGRPGGRLICRAGRSSEPLHPITPVQVPAYPSLDYPGNAKTLENQGFSASG